MTVSRQPIFLFSLPRSGSTLLQRVLAAHSQIVSTAEPWVLLPLLQGLTPRTGLSEHGHTLALRAIVDFRKQLAGGQDTIDRQVRQFAAGLYDDVKPGIEARYFLDKTPRYALVSDDIQRIFPDAKLVLLWRNPLAIISSMVSTWERGRWRLWPYNVDLYTGLTRLMKAYEANPDRFFPVNYEALVKDPLPQLQALFDHLELDFEPNVLKDFADVKWSGHMGDPTGISEYNSVDSGSIDKWRGSLNGAVRKAWLRRWLNWIGRERLAIMGYELDALLDDVASLGIAPTRIPRDLYFSGVSAGVAIAQRAYVRRNYRSEEPILRRSILRP